MRSLSGMIISLVLLNLPFSATAGGPDIPGNQAFSNRTQSVSLPFQGVHADGHFQVHLMMTRGPSSYQIQSTDVPEKLLKVFLKNGELFLQDKDKKPHEATVVAVYLNQLSRLTALGRTSFEGAHLWSNHLAISSYGRNDITLKGRLDLQSLDVGGTSETNLMWVSNLSTLKLHLQDQSSVTLAGAAKIIEARLLNQSQLKARYLRAQSVLITANDDAAAQVFAVDGLYAYANQRANIYFYTMPKQLSRFSKQQGNVLQLKNPGK